MNDRNAPTLKKWPFYLADAALLGFAIWLFSHYPHPLAAWTATLITACVVVAAVLAVWPFRVEYETQVRLCESDRLTSATDAIKDLQDVSNLIRQATGQWQGVQDHAGKTAHAAREIADRMTAEARAFSEFMSKANDSEKSTLRLEVEKLRRGEQQWLQVLVHTLDHVNALYQAGARSGQPNLAAQLNAFQTACRDLARRVGLVPIDAEVDQPFDATQHDTVEGESQADGSAVIRQVVATGFSFQGQVLRKPIVVLKSTQDSADLTGDDVAAEDLPAEGLALEDQAADDLAVGNSLGDASAVSDDFSTSVHDVVTETVTADAGTLSEDPAGDSSDEDVDEFRLESDSVDDDGRRQAGNA